MFLLWIKFDGNLDTQTQFLPPLSEFSFSSTLIICCTCVLFLSKLASVYDREKQNLQNAMKNLPKWWQM